MLRTSATNLNLKTIASVDPTVVEMLVEATAHGDDVIIQRDGEAVLVAVSPARYEELAELRRWDDWQKILTIADRNEDLDPENVLRRVTEDVEEVRDRLYREGKLG